MHLLHRRLEEDSDLREAVMRLSERIMGNPLKHGLMLDLNPFWLAAYRLADAGLDESLLDRLIDGDPRLRIGSLLERLSAGASGALDLDRRFPVAERMTEHVFGHWGSKRSVMLRIFALPIATPDNEQFELRRELVDAAREARVPTIVDTQEAARLVAAPGDRLVSTAGALGTLGGFLRDGPGGQVLAATCGHVLTHGGVSIPKGRSGVCLYGAAPLTLPPGMVCHANCGFQTNLDLALIDFPGAAPSNVAQTVAQIISPGDIVDMQGASSGHRRYEVGGAMVDHTIGGACWTKLYQVHAPVSVGILPTAVNVAATPPPKPGDSGAWLIRGGGEWAGMVVAANALHGYALAGSTVLSEGDARFKTKLRLA